MPNVKSVINSHNQNILYNHEKTTTKTCNCINKSTCVMNNQCLSKTIVYQATVSSNKPDYTDKVYISISETPFKLRYANHLKSFNLIKYSNDTELSKEIWKLKEEKFLKRQNWLSELKLRLGYGQSGNNRIGAFLYDTFFTASSDYGYAFGSGVTPGATTGNIMANPKIKWESTTSTNAGLDFGFLKGRIYGTLDFYNTDTNDLLLLAKIPQTSGYEYKYKN